MTEPVLEKNGAKPEKIIFLDISGVLASERYQEEHPENVAGMIKFIDPDAVEKINMLCEAHGAKIVIISSYTTMGKKNVETELRQAGWSADFAQDWELDYVVPNHQDNLVRGPAIAKYCKLHNMQPKDYIIIADINDELDPFFHQLVERNPDYSPEQSERHVQPLTHDGLLEDDYLKADRLLGNTPSASDKITQQRNATNGEEMGR